MPETTPGILEPASEATLPLDLATASSVSYDDVRRLREAAYASEASRRHFAKIADALPERLTGSATDKAWRQGAALFVLGRYGEAAEHLRKVRGSLDATRLAGMSLVRAGRAAEGASVLEEAVREKPTDPTLRASLFEAYEAAGDFEALAKGVKGAPKSFEGTADLAYFEGRLAELDRRTADAVNSYDRALSLDPRHRGALFRLAKELDLRGEDAEAVGLYERLAALKPVDAAALLNLGILYEDGGDYHRALACFEAVLRVDPPHERARLFKDDAAASISMYYDEDEEKKEDKLQQLLRTPISDFELSVRARNCLQKMEIGTLGDLVRKTEAELLAYKNFGETSLAEIRELLTAKGLRLGMLRDQIEAEAIARMEVEAVERTLELDDEETLARKEAAEDAAEERADALARPFTDLPLSARTKRSFEGLTLQTIGDLAKMTAEELSKLPNFGPTALEEIREKLTALGLDLAG